MKVLLDTDILLDVALRRPGFFEDSAAVVSWAEANPGEAAVAWHSVANLFYLVRPDGRKFIRELLDFVEVARVGSEEMRAALGFPMKDLRMPCRRPPRFPSGRGTSSLGTSRTTVTPPYRR